MGGQMVGRQQKSAQRRLFARVLAEQAGFEPAVGY